MKKLIMIFTAIACALFAGCSDIQTENAVYDDNDIPEGYAAVYISVSTDARVISPFDISKVESWTLEGSPHGDDGGGGFSVSVADLTKRVLIMKGHWDLKLSGYYFQDDFAGTSVSVFSLTHEYDCTAGDGIGFINFSMKCSSGAALPYEGIAYGTGDLSYTLNFDTKTRELLNTAGDITVTAVLTPHMYFFDEDGNLAEAPAENPESVECTTKLNDGNVTVTAYGLRTGYYFLSVVLTADGTEYNLRLKDSYFHVARSMTTTAEADCSGYVLKNPVIYGTSGESAGNGIIADYPKNLNEILEAYSGTAFTVQMGDDVIPVIDLDLAGDGTECLINYTKTVGDGNVMFTITISSSDSSSVGLYNHGQLLDDMNPVLFKTKNSNYKWNIFTATTNLNEMVNLNSSTPDEDGYVTWSAGS